MLDELKKEIARVDEIIHVSKSIINDSSLQYSPFHSYLTTIKKPTSPTHFTPSNHVELSPKNNIQINLSFTSPRRKESEEQEQEKEHERQQEIEDIIITQKNSKNYLSNQPHKHNSPHKLQ